MEAIDWRLTDEEILVFLNESVKKRLPADKTRDDTAWVSLNRIAHVFDAATLSAMRQSLENHGYGDFYAILIGGDDFGKPKVQEILAALHEVDPSVFTAEKVRIMQSWGITEGPRWSIELAMGTEPTLATIAAERAQHEGEVHRQKAKVAGIRFGDQFPVGGDAGAVMTTIWGEINGGN